MLRKLGTGFIAEPQGRCTLCSHSWEVGKLPVERVLHLPPPARPASGQNREAALALRSQENVGLGVHTPGLQVHTAATPLSCPSNPPTEDTASRWAGVRQAADLASARTLPPDRNFPTFHSLLTSVAIRLSTPTPRGPQSSVQEGSGKEAGATSKAGPHPSNRQSPEPRNPGQTCHAPPPGQI